MDFVNKKHVTIHSSKEVIIDNMVSTLDDIYSLEFEAPATCIRTLIGRTLVIEKLYSDECNIDLPDYNTIECTDDNPVYMIYGSRSTLLLVRDDSELSLYDGYKIEFHAKPEPEPRTYSKGGVKIKIYSIPKRSTKSARKIST